MIVIEGYLALIGTNYISHSILKTSQKINIRGTSEIIQFTSISELMVRKAWG